MPNSETIQQQFFYAICNNHPIEHLEKLRQKGANLNEPNPTGDLPIHLAARLEQTTILDWLVAEGCSLISLNTAQQIPLHIAAQYNQSGTTLAILATLEQRLSSSKLANLLKHNDRHGKTPLGYACEHGNEPLISAFIKLGADISQITNRNHNHYVLHELAFHNQIAPIPELLRAGATPDLLNQYGQTAFTVGLLQNARWSLALLAAQYPVDWQATEQSDLTENLTTVKQALLENDYEHSTYKLDILRRQAETIDCLPIQSFCLAQQAILELNKGRQLAEKIPQAIATAAELKKQHQAYQHYVKAALYINGAYAYYQLQSKQTVQLPGFLPPNYDQYLTDHLYVIEACMLQELFHTKYPKHTASSPYQQNLAEHLRYNNLPAHRKSLADHLQHVDSLLADGEAIASILLENTRKTQAIFIQMLHETLEILGPPPCEYAIKFVGSWERSEMSLCSDIEWFILIEQETSETLAYFRKLSQLIHLKFINLGQTPLYIQTQSPNPALQKAIKSKALSPTPQGIRIDESYLTPLGNPEWPFALIGTPATLLKFQEAHWSEVLPELQYALRAISLNPESSLTSANGNKLLTEYLNELDKKLNSKEKNAKNSQRQIRALSLLEQHIYDDYPLRLTSIAEGGALNVKNDLYRPLSMLISDLALYYGISKTNTWDCLEELHRQGYLSRSVKQGLFEALNSCIRFRILAQRHYGTEHEMLWHRQTFDQDIIVPYLAELKPNFLLNEPQLQELTGIYQVLLPIYELARQFIQIRGKNNGFANHNLVLTDPIGQYLAQGLTLEAVGDYTKALEAYLSGLGINRSAPELLLRSAICAAELNKRGNKTLSASTYLKALIEPLLAKTTLATEFLPYYRSLPGVLRDELRQLLLQYEPEYKRVNDILRILNQYPEKTGKRQAVLLEEQQWRSTLQTLTTEYTGTPNSVRLESPLLGRCQLKPEVVGKLFDEKLNFHSHKINKSQHDVIPIEIEGKKLYIKKDPEMPGMTYFIDQMHQRIIGHGTSRSELAKLVVGNKVIPVLISEEVAGENLNDVLRESPEQLQKLDHKSICELILLALLTYPEDGKASNYILTTLGENYTLKSIDHDHAMFPAITRDYNKITGKPEDTLHLKTLLFCLNNMLEKIDPEARQQFLEIDIDALLRSLFLDAQQKNQQYTELFGNKIIQAMYKNSNKGSSTIPIPLKKGDALLLRERFVRLQQLLKADPAVTPMDLLNELEPRVAKKYQLAFKKDTCPNKRFNAAAGQHYKKENGHLITSTSAKASLQIDKSILLGTNYLKLHDLDPAESLAELDKRIYEQSLLGEVREKLQQGTVKSFMNLLTTSHKELIINGDATQPGLDFQKMTDTSNQPDLAKQKTVLEAIIAKAPYQRLKLRYCQALNRKTLLELLRAVPDILELDLSHCYELTDKEIISIAKLCPTLQTLHLQGCHQLKNIKGLFPALKYLNITGCKRLLEVDIKAVQLHTLKAKSCFQLKGVRTRSEHLKIANLTLCRSLVNVTYLTENFQLLEQCLHTDGRVRTNTEFNTNNQSETARWLQLLRDCSHKNVEIINFDDYFRFNPAQDLAVLQTMLKNAERLRELNLGNKKYKVDEVEILLKTLLDKTGLTKLNLARCELSEQSMEILATILANNPNLKLLNLSRCKINSERFNLLKPALINHKNLASLVLDNNILETEGAAIIFELLQAQTSIKNLDVGYNELGDQGMKAFAEVIRKDQLVSLHLECNKIDNGVAYLISGLKASTRMLELNISCNPDINEKQQNQVNKLLLRNKKLAEESQSQTHYQPLYYPLANITRSIDKDSKNSLSQENINESTEAVITLTP